MISEEELKKIYDGISIPPLAIVEDGHENYKVENKKYYYFLWKCK